MISETLNILKQSVVKYIDEDKLFAYCSFSNREEQVELEILDNKGKVIVFDTRTGYINVSLLVEAFRDTPAKEFSVLSKSKYFKEQIESLETDINRDQHPNKKYLKYPNYDNKTKYFRALYKINPSSRTVGFAGTYAHPNLLVSILSWSNYKLCIKLSTYFMSALLHEGVNENMSIDTLIEDENASMNESLQCRQQIVNIIENGTKEEINNIEDITFDIVQYAKVSNYLAQVHQEYMQKNKNGKILTDSTNQAVIIIDNYDEGKYKFGGSLHKLTFMLINEEDVEKYVNKFSRVETNLTEEELEEQLFTGMIKIKYDVILKMISLRKVPQDFVQNYISIYEEQFPVWIEKIKTKNYVITSDIKALIETFTEYIGDYMIV